MDDTAGYIWVATSRLRVEMGMYQVEFSQTLPNFDPDSGKQLIDPQPDRVLEPQDPDLSDPQPATSFSPDPHPGARAIYELVVAELDKQGRRVSPGIVPCYENWFYLQDPTRLATLVYNILWTPHLFVSVTKDTDEFQVKASPCYSHAIRYHQISGHRLLFLACHPNAKKLRDELRLRCCNTIDALVEAWSDLTKASPAFYQVFDPAVPSRPVVLPLIRLSEWSRLCALYKHPKEWLERAPGLKPKTFPNFIQLELRHMFNL